MDKQSGDEVARLASKLMQPPLVDDATCDDLILAIAQANSGAEARIAIRRALEPLAKQVRRVAASVVSQADGEE
jgi:hypothetical protein